MTGTVIRRLARPLLLGTAVRDGGSVVFRCTGIDSTDLNDAERSTVGIDLARVRTPDEAVAFVGKYGPIGQLPDGFFYGEDTLRATTRFACAVEIRESIEDVLEAGRRINEILVLSLDVRKSLRGSTQALQRLDRWARDHNYDDWDVQEGHSTRENDVSLSIAAILRKEIQGASAHFTSTGAGEFEIRLRADTLRTFCYLTVAWDLSTAALALCDECARVFAVEDARQKFCEPKCANRARFRRYTHGLTGRIRKRQKRSKK